MRLRACLTKSANIHSSVKSQKANEVLTRQQSFSGERLVVLSVVLTCIIFGHKRWHAGQMRSYLN